ncbi:MAG: hypothetical protein U9R50_12025 [Campylobacterota bacterium]|nr:hypothetical protein [Campylobacterota bacterium]
MNLRYIFFLLLALDTLLLIFVIPYLSISYHEAQIFFNDTSFMHHLITTSTSIFGQNNFALRFPTLVLHILSIILLYAIAKAYIRYESDRLWLIGIYMLLPGINSVAILVDDAGLILFFVLLYIFLAQRYYTFSYILLPLLIVVNEGFMFLYMGVAFYAYEQQKHKLFVASTGLFMLSLLVYGFDVSGAPRGQFLDTLGIYAVIFSPIVFLYLFYVLYRRALIGPRDQLFYVATSAFLLSLLLSFRQKINVEIFAPYLMVALPLLMQNFFHSYRIRLPQFRTKYRLLFGIAFTLLVLNALSVFFHKEIYYFLKTPKDHFAYRLHIVDSLAEKLQEQGITCINANNQEMQLRLSFYGISHCDGYRLIPNREIKNSVNVTIFHRNLLLYQASVTKMHD